MDSKIGLAFGTTELSAIAQSGDDLIFHDMSGFKQATVVVTLKTADANAVVYLNQATDENGSGMKKLYPVNETTYINNALTSRAATLVTTSSSVATYVVDVDLEQEVVTAAGDNTKLQTYTFHILSTDLDFANNYRFINVVADRSSGTAYGYVIRHDGYLSGASLRTANY